MSLKSDLQDTFDSMKSLTEGGDDYFAKHVTQNCADYFESRIVSTTNVAGAIASGTYVAGTGNGNPDCALTKGACESALLSAMKAMRNMVSGGDVYFATEIANAIHTMYTGAKVEFTVSGICTPPSTPPPPYPLLGIVKGTISGSNSSLLSGIIATFNSMRTMSDGGDEYFATQLASHIETYALALTCILTGQGAISGAVGTGGLT
jgi:hypothetical protein